MFLLPIRMELRPSHQIRIVLTGLHSIACVSLWLANTPMGVKLAGTLLLLASGVYYNREMKPMILQAKGDGGLELLRGGTWQQAQVLANAIILPNLAVLRYRFPDNSGVHTLIILPDCLPPDDFRRLRVWLRWRPVKPVNSLLNQEG